jgi:PST family polysaccharide transporter
MKRTVLDFLERPQPEGLKSKAIKGGGASLVAEIISFAVRVVSVILLARLLEPRDFGLVTMVTTFYLLLLGFGLNGFTEYVIQKEGMSQAELSNLFWLHGIINFVLTLCFMAAAPIMAAFYKEPAVKYIAIVMATGIMAQMLSTLHLALLKRRMEFSKVGLITVMARVLSVAIAIGMALGNFRYWAIVGRQLSEIVFMAIGSWILCPWRPGLPKNLKNEYGALRFALRIYGNYTLDYLSRNLDKVLLGRFHGSKVLGYYDRAYHIASMPIDQLANPLSGVGLATLSPLRTDLERYTRYFTKALCLLAFVGVLASLLVSVTGRDLVRIFIGPRWEQAGYVVMAFGPGIGVRILYSTCGWIHLSLGRPERLMRWNLISTAFIAAALFVAAVFGPVWVAWAYSISFYVLLVPALWYAGRPIGLKVVPLLSAVAPYFAAGLISFFSWMLLTRSLPVTSAFLGEMGAGLRFSVALGFNTVLYAAMVVVLHGGLAPLREMLSVIKTLIFREKSGIRDIGSRA